MSFLTSSRLYFRTWSESDLALAASLWTDPDVTRYLGGSMSPEAVHARLRQEIERQLKFGFQYWPIFLRADDAFAGCAGLRPFHDEPGVLEMGVHIAHRYWGAGLGEEAAKAVIAYAFDELGANAVTAGHNPENINSKALLERLAFVFTHTEPWGPFDVETPFYRLERTTRLV